MTKSLPIDAREIAELLRYLTPEESAALQEVLTSQSETIAEEFGRKYFSDPVGFVRECTSLEFVSYQANIVEDLLQFGRVAARGPHGLGKSMMAACLVHWFALTRNALRLDWKIITTASVWRQLEKFLWPEIHKVARAINWAKVGRAPYDPRAELMQTQLRLSHGEASAVASSEPQKMEGAHADHLLFIFDEAKIIPDATWDALEGAMSNAGADTESVVYVLAVSTPGDPVGRFYDIHQRKTGYDDWHVRHVTVEEAIAAGRISAEWVERRRAQWGEGSQLFRNRALGEFHTQVSHGLIPLDWILAAQVRWRSLREQGADLPPLTRLGVDVGRGGDRSIIAPIHDFFVDELTSLHTPNVLAVSDFVRRRLRGSDALAIVDVIGIGAGVVDSLRRSGDEVFAFHSSASTELTDASGEVEFHNLRAAAYWNLRELLNPYNGFSLALPPDDLLLEELVATGYAYTQQGRLIIESKDKLRRRLRRSPDRADAVAMGFFPAISSAPMVAVSDVGVHITHF